MALRVSRQHVEALYVPDPNIRVSRQHVEYLGVVPGTIRVSRQHVEYLVPAVSIHDESASSTLVLTQGVLRVASIFNRSASSSLSMIQGVGKLVNLSVGNTLELTDELNYHGPISRSAVTILDISSSVRIPLVIPVEASSTLEMDQAAYSAGSIYVSASNNLELQVFADEIVKFRPANSTLSLEQSVDVDKVVPASSALELTQSAHVDSVSKTASSEITLTQFARAEPFAQSVTSTITLSQTARSQFQFASTSSTLELDQVAIAAKPIRVSAESDLTTTEEVWDFDTFEFVTTETGLRHSVANAGDLSRLEYSQLNFKQSVDVFKVLATAIPGVATSAMSLSQSVWASLTLGPEAESIIVLAQASTGDIGYSADDSTLSLEQTAVYSVIRAARTSSSEIGVTQSVTYVLETGSSRHQYTPFVGTSTDPNAPTPPPEAIDGPMVGIEVPFQLVYPSLGVVTDSVGLKTPNLGNKDRLAFNRVLRETRGGTLIVFADPIWPKVQTLVLTFSGLLRVEAYELQTFISDHLGQEIGLIDWEHRYWRGVITTPDEPLVEDRFDSYTTSFDFEGELDSDWNPQIVPIDLRYSATRSERADGYYVPSDPILPTMPSSTDYYTAITAADLDDGQPVYITGVGEVDLAKADSQSTTEIVGFVQVDCLSGETCRYLTEGMIERLDWTNITGASELAPGATYFLDSVTAGRITATAPTTVGQFVVRVGRAINARTLDIEIELPILL